MNQCHVQCTVIESSSALFASPVTPPHVHCRSHVLCYTSFLWYLTVFETLGWRAEQVYESGAECSIRRQVCSLPSASMQAENVCSASMMSLICAKSTNQNRCYRSLQLSKAITRRVPGSTTSLLLSLSPNVLTHPPRCVCQCTDTPTRQCTDTNTHANAHTPNVLTR